MEISEGQRIGDCGIISDAHCKRCDARHHRTPCPYRGVPFSPDADSIKTTREWIRDRCFKTKSGEGDSCYGLKHVMERENQLYVPVGIFISAALAEGYEVISIHVPHCNLNIRLKTDRNKRYWNKASAGGKKSVPGFTKEYPRYRKNIERDMAANPEGGLQLLEAIACCKTYYDSKLGQSVPYQKNYQYQARKMLAELRPGEELYCSQRCTPGLCSSGLQRKH